MSRRFDLSSIPAGAEWQDLAAKEVVRLNPDKDTYTLAAGISPSGPVHFGNFRDIVTSYAVAENLKKLDKKTRLIFSWDNFDRLRKVPAGVPESFAEHIGKPLSYVPDPTGERSSYAEHFQKPFEEAMERLGIELEYKNQTALYESGAYDEDIFFALTHRTEIADILLSFMTEKGKGEKGIEPDAYREAYYPISLYSRFTGKDATKILSYDGDTSVTYYCAESGKQDTVDLSKDRIAKLAWKVDWPMRWRKEGVVFEPGGHDHASPGGSYDVSSTIAEKIFSYAPPVFVEYKFVGIQGLGAKMSGSKGNAVTPKELLGIYEPELLRWMYLRKRPDQSFQLAFDSEIYRQYDEYDAEMKNNAIPFRQAVSFGQIVQWQEGKLDALLSGMNLSYTKESIEARLPRAKHWLTEYNPDEAVTLLSEQNRAYIDTMTEERKEKIRVLHDALQDGMKEIPELETFVYDVPKEEGLSESDLKKAQRAFFKDVYNLLIGKDTGPRLGTFLWAAERENVLALLGRTD